jgi:hypothetical protein
VELLLRLRGRQVSPEVARALAEWAPIEERDRIADLLQRGGRWPQEALTAAHLEELLAER